MISEIRLTNFKCFQELTLPLPMFTLLSGLNGMGKSSVIQSILLLRQSWRSGDLKLGRLALNGELTELGTGNDILFEGANFDHVGIGLNLVQTRDSQHFSAIPMDFLYTYDRGADSLISTVSDPETNREIMRIASLSNCESGLALIQDSRNLANLNEIVRQSGSASFKAGVEQLIMQKNWMDSIALEAVSPFAGQFHYVFAERFGPRKMLPLSESHVREKNLGLHGEYVLHFLMEYGKKITVDEADPRFSSSLGFGANLEDQVDAWLQEISPGSHLSIEAIRRTDTAASGFSFDQPNDIRTRAFRPTNVGFGLSYVLPVLVALLSAEPGAVVLLENPEAHMHPQGQTCLGQLAARAAAAGVQVILETHSDHIMNGARIDIRTGGSKRLAPDNAAFHFFERKGIVATVTSPKIGEDGRLSDWPSGFFDQHEENLIELLAPRQRDI